MLSQQTGLRLVNRLPCPRFGGHLRQIDGVDASVLAIATDPLAPVHVTLAAAFPTHPPAAPHLG